MTITSWYCSNDRWQLVVVVERSRLRLHHNMNRVLLFGKVQLRGSPLLHRRAQYHRCLHRMYSLMIH